jgi:hypothetical protein
VLVLVLGAGGVGAHALTSSNGSSPQSVPTARSSTSGATPTLTPPAPGPSATPTPSSSPTPRQRQHRAPALTLAITGGVSWIEVGRPTGRVLFRGLLRHGRRLTYVGGPLTLVIGDAGAVRLVRHGHITQPAGRPGEVLRLRIS